MSDEKCQRCGDSGPDLRTITMSCSYDMSELGLPFERAVDASYLLDVCKNCRASWLESIKIWFNESATTKPIGSGIFVRRNGINVEITEEEWARENPGREPVRVRK